MELLDVGGGFTGHFDACGNVMFGEIANTINQAVARYFPPERGVRVIAEPGRYFAGISCVMARALKQDCFLYYAVHIAPSKGSRVCTLTRLALPHLRHTAETSASLLTPIYGHRDRMDYATGVLKKDYWITDGLYGSFNCILYDGQNPEYQVRCCFCVVSAMHA
eukprot:1061519-Pelagomonas_calceolata.AAC.3